MEPKPVEALEFITPLPSKRRKMDVIADSTEEMQTKLDIMYKLQYSLSELQSLLGDFRDKYTEAIEKLMHKRSKLEIKKLNQQCEAMVVKPDCTLTVPDFKVPAKVESQSIADVVENFDELIKRIDRQMDVIETLEKMRSCPIAQAMLKL